MCSPGALPSADFGTCGPLFRPICRYTKGTMGTRERHIGHAAARTAPVADPRGGRLFAMPRFLVGITHQVYRHRVFAIAGAITALFLMLLAVLPALFAFDPKLSNAVPAYSKVSEEVVDALAHSSSLPLLVAAIVFSIWGVSVYLRCFFSNILSKKPMAASHQQVACVTFDDGGVRDLSRYPDGSTSLHNWDTWPIFDQSPGTLFGHSLGTYATGAIGATSR